MSNPLELVRYKGLCDSDIKNLDGTPVNLWTTGNYEKVRCPVDYDYTNQRAIYKETIAHRLYCQMYQGHVRAHILKKWFL